MTSRNPDPSFSWASNHKKFEGLKNRDSYIGKYLLILHKIVTLAYLYFHFYFCKMKFDWSYDKVNLTE